MGRSGLKPLVGHLKVGDVVDPGGRCSWSAPNPCPELTWYVLTVAPMCERLVANRLKRQHGGVVDDDGELIAPGLATYVPLARREVRRRGSRYVIERAALPLYLFVGFADQPRWLDVFEVADVRGVLGFDGVPYAVRPELVGELIAREWSGRFDEAAPPRVQRFMRVVATRGILAGSEGDVVAIDKDTACASVLFELYGSMPVPIALDDLVSVAHQRRRMIG